MTTRFVTLALAAAAAAPAWAEGGLPPAALQNRPAPLARPASGPSPFEAESDIVVKPRKKTRVATVRDCGQPTRAPVLWGRADHGTVTIKQGHASGCGHPSMSVDLVFYQSNPGFKGTDKLYMLGFLLDGTLDQSYSVSVK